jgi:uncharacterized protein YhaN
VTILEIKRLSIGEFGKFNQFDIELHNGINVIYGKNEAGKSTIHSFIEGVLTGLNGYRYNIPVEDDFVNRYKPWGDSHGFEGSVEYSEDGHQYKVFRDFNKDTEGIIFTQDGHEISADELQADQSKDFHYLNILGITDITNKTGKSLIQEMKNHITNIGQSNNQEIEVDQAIETLEEELEQLRKTSDYEELTSQVRHYEDNLKEVEQGQFQKKNELKTYFAMKARIEEATVELEDLEEQLSEYRADENTYKEDKINAYNEQIQLLNEKMEQLVKEQDDSVEDLEKLAGLKASLRSNLDRMDYLEEELRLIKLSRDDITKQHNPGMEMVLTSEIDSKDFLGDFRDYLDEIEALQQVSEEISVSQKRMADETAMKANADFGVNVAYESLEKDYQSLSNLYSWKETLEASEDKSSEEEELKQDIDKYGKSKNNYRLLMNALEVVLLILVMGAFFFSKYYPVFIVLIVGIGVYLLINRRLMTEASTKFVQKSSDLKALEENVVTTRNRIKNTEEKIQKLLDKHQVSSLEDLEESYKIAKSNKEDEQHLLRKIDELLTKQDELDSAVQIRESHMQEWFRKLGVDGDHGYGFDEATLKRFMELMDKYKSLTTYEERRVKAEEEISELRDKNYFINKDIHALELTSHRDNEKNTAYEASREELIALTAKLTKIKQESENLENFDEHSERLRGRILKLKEELNSWSVYKEESRLRANAITNEQVIYSRISKKIRMLNERIESVEQSIDIYECTIQGIKSAIHVLTTRFKDSLNTKINKIVQEVTHKYDEILLDDDVSLHVVEKETGHKINIEKLSLGTIDQIHFALRVGLISAVKDQLTIPLILDDCFVQYDDERLEKMMEEVSKLNRQVILFSCHKREREILDKMSVEYNYIEL